MSTNTIMFTFRAWLTIVVIGLVCFDCRNSTSPPTPSKYGTNLSIDRIREQSPFKPLLPNYLPLKIDIDGLGSIVPDDEDQKYTVVTVTYNFTLNRNEPYLYLYESNLPQGVIIIKQPVGTETLRIGNIEVYSNKGSGLFGNADGGAFNETEGFSFQWQQDNVNIIARIVEPDKEEAIKVIKSIIENGRQNQ